MQERIAAGKNTARIQLRLLVANEEISRSLTQILERLQVYTLSYHEPEAFFTGDGLVNPGCVLVDWQAGPPDGLEVAARCRTQWPNAGVLLASEHATAAFTMSAIRNGVDGVLETPIDPDELIREVQAAIDRSHSRCTKKYDPEDARRRIKRISDVEMEILKLIADGVPNKNIALAMSMSLRTVEKHRHSLLVALGVGSAAEATRIWVLANLGE